MLFGGKLHVFGEQRLDLALLLRSQRLLNHLSDPVFEELCRNLVLLKGLRDLVLHDRLVNLGGDFVNKVIGPLLGCTELVLQGVR